MTTEIRYYKKDETKPDSVERLYSPIFRRFENTKQIKEFCSIGIKEAKSDNESENFPQLTYGKCGQKFLMFFYLQQ